MTHRANELVENKAERNRSGQNTKRLNKCFHWTGQSHIAHFDNARPQEMHHGLLTIKLLLSPFAKCPIA